MLMRTIETALWPTEQPTVDMGMGVFLGDVDEPRLADLTEGERVVLVDPNELQAEATLRTIELGGRLVWFAEIGDPDSIQVIYPKAPESSDTPSIRH